MRSIIDEYGNSILLVILASGCIWMYCNVFYGTGSFISGVYNQVFSQSTSDHLTTSTIDGTCTIIGSDGSQTSESQQESASTIEEIAKRKAPTMSSKGVQNVDQAIVGQSYDTDQLMCGLADDGSGNLSIEINTSIGKTGDSITNYFRVMSVTVGNGEYLISDTADVSHNPTDHKANGICYASSSYADRVGRADDRSDCIKSGSDFIYEIYKPATNTSHGQAERWFTYNMTKQKWTFYKAGTYCFRCFIVDEKGKSATGTAYVAVSRSNTVI